MSIENFERTDGLFSLCGLNCGLCGYRLQGNCNGCFKDSSCAAVCPMAPCSVRHGNLQYCFECPEYPCEHYDEYLQLRMYLAPVTAPARPFTRNIHHIKIQHFKQAVIRRENPLVLVTLSTIGACPKRIWN